MTVVQAFGEPLDLGARDAIAQRVARAVQGVLGPAANDAAPLGLPDHEPAEGDAPGEAEVRELCRRVVGADDGLSNAELLRLCFLFALSRSRADAVAAALLTRFGSLGGVCAAPVERLRGLVGAEAHSVVVLLKTVHAVARRVLREPLEDRPNIGSSGKLRDYLSVTLRHETREVVRVLFLDRKNGLILDELHGRGTVDHAPLYPREVLRRVLELGASSIILVHNHPSGDPTPSQADVETTRQVAGALASIDVALHDHIIVGRNGQTSFRRLGLL